MQLSDLYDGDRALTDQNARYLRRIVMCPHPLHEVQYADGFLPDTTAGRVKSHGRRVVRDARP